MTMGGRVARRREARAKSSTCGMKKLDRYEAMSGSNSLKHAPKMRNGKMPRLGYPGLKLNYSLESSAGLSDKPIFSGFEKKFCFVEAPGSFRFDVVWMLVQ